VDAADPVDRSDLGGDPACWSHLLDAPDAVGAAAPVRTVGHGTLGAPELTVLLQQVGIDVIADVRRFPGSRRHPHVAREAMAEWLPAAGIDYHWIEALGGRRPSVPDSPHRALRNPQFRAYADHMTTPEFRRGLVELGELRVDRTVAVLCAESVWWRCHRRLLADHLVLIEGTPVEHLFHDGRLAPHAPTPEARVEADDVLYDLHDQPALFS
jgi:uncharacterized protein (DUF488 family)